MTKRIPVYAERTTGDVRALFPNVLHPGGISDAVRSGYTGGNGASSISETTPQANLGGTPGELEKIANHPNNLRHLRTVPIYTTDMDFVDLGDNYKGYVGILKPDIATPGNVLYFQINPKEKTGAYSVVLFESPPQPEKYHTAGKGHPIKFGEIYMLANGNNLFFNLKFPDIKKSK